MLTPEQMMAAQKANMETLLGLTHKAFEGVEKLVELNMQLARAAMTDSTDTAKAALTVKDAQELLALQAQLLQPAAEKAAAYNRSLYEIAQATNAEWIKVAEAQMAAAQKNLHAMIDTAAKGAPAGSENAVALVKSAVTAANNAFESVHKAAKQAADMTEANLQAMASSAMGAATMAAKPAGKAASKSSRRSA
jgi:phasin family protein